MPIVGTNGNDVLVGGAGNDVLIGGGGHDLLDGRAGADRMEGGAGDDTYFVDSSGDQTIERENEGTDLVYSSISHILRAHLERLILTGTAHTSATGNAAANILIGNAGNNRLDGGAGADLMKGREGDDTYVVDNVGDRIEETAGHGVDIVYASVTHVLAYAVDNLVLTGSAAIGGTGNADANILIGNAGNNRLDGSAGADLMKGREGNDTYFVDNVGDRIEETAGHGVDIVYASVTHVLAYAVDNLILTGSAAIGGTGNADANVLIGNAGNNRLDGSAGADLMKGREGDDVYVVDNVGDRIEEAAGQGTDLVLASATHILAYAVDHLTLTGTANIDATGNGLANALLGNAGNNVMNGLGGADLMQGRGGNDTYHVDNAGDVADEAFNQGVDTVIASIGYALDDEVENLTLTGAAPINGTGNARANQLTGNSGSNRLDGGGGADLMSGGAGDDFYVVDDTADQVTENPGEGLDTVESLVSYILGASVERLTLVGFSAIGGTGNDLANVVQGNGAGNLLDGGLGSDTLSGGVGADTYAFSTALGAGNVDTIVGGHTDGFNAAEDRILLGGLAGQPFAALASGALSPGSFVSGTAARDADDYLIYDPATGGLSYDADGYGSGAATPFAHLPAGLGLTAGHFMVAGPANQLPTISSPASATVTEGSPAGTLVYQAAATDADGDRITFSLAGTDAGLLTLDDEGAVRLNAAADFETRGAYRFTLVASDSAPNDASQAVTISVTDVGESLSIVAETSVPNDSYGLSQFIESPLFTVSGDPHLPDPALPSVRIQGDIASSSDRDFFALDLDEGELLILDVDGTVSLDSFLRVYSLAGIETASNDDPGTFDPGSTAHPGVSHNMDSFVRFRAPETGTYRFSIEAFAEPGGPISSGAYKINVSIGPPATLAQIHRENVEALISGEKWSSPNLTYGFPTSPSQYAPGTHDGEPSDNFGAFAPNQQAAVRQILGQFAQLTGLSFTELGGSPGTAQLRYAMSDAPDTAHAYYPGSGGLSGSSWYNKSSGNYSSPVLGNYAWLALVHETGHALGLKHGHEAPALSFERDSLEFSVMTYRSHVGAATDGDAGYTNETFGFPQSLMMYDIGAFQRMYGADFTLNGGDSVYSWNPSTGQMSINGAGQAVPGTNRVFMTVWDGGGIDTYDLSNYTNVTRIDLHPGEWVRTSEVQLANLGDGHYARGNVANALQYDDDPRSLIENAIGGSSNDHIVANQAVNRLTGNAGLDIFQWTSASDSAPGSADTVTDFDNVFDDTPTDRINLISIDANGGTAGDDAFTFVGTSAFSATAGELRYQVEGNSVRLQGDTDGNGLADFEIVLANLTWMDSGFMHL